MLVVYILGWPCVSADKKETNKGRIRDKWGRAGCNLMLSVCKMLVTCFNTHTHTHTHTLQVVLNHCLTPVLLLLLPFYFLQY